MKRSIRIITDLSQDTLDPEGHCTTTELAEVSRRYQAAVIRDLQRVYPDTDVDLLPSQGALRTQVYAIGFAGKEQNVERDVQHVVQDIWDCQKF